ncbi:MAG TPA: dihydroorotase [Phycisphaerales bacterium]|nr:dihydroorotase [Phycisphaerales bacterium]
MSAVLIKGGRVIDPASGLDATGDVLIVDGVIRQIEKKSGKAHPDSKTTVLDAEGCIVCPGLIDIHVHLREPSTKHAETIASGAEAAINGGFSTVCCMPNTTPALDSEILVEYIAMRALRANMARVFTVGAATAERKGQSLAPILAMAKAGAVAFSDDGDGIADAGVMSAVLRTVKAAGKVFMQHCQEPTLTRGGVMNGGTLATKMGLGGWPAVAEEVMIERDVRLNRDIGCRYHVQHVSAGGSVEIVRRAQADGEPVTAEAAPHHLLLTEDLCEGYNTQAKVNPPLRRKSDVDRLKSGIAEGVITVLATDHAPHPLESKQTDFASAAFGMAGLECALPLYVRALVEDGVIEWPRLIALMTHEPARVAGLEEMGLGRLAVDGPGDVTVIDPEEEWVIEPEKFKSAGRNTPFAGWKVKGRAKGVVVGGAVKMWR